MAPAFLELKVQIVRFVDDDDYDFQPGFVETEFTDSAGQAHRIIDKVPIFTVEMLTAESVYPQVGTVRCKLLRQWQDSDGRNLLTISVAKPFGVETSDGLTEFDVLLGQVSAVDMP